MTELPRQGLFVTGTDTDVGKTWVGVHILKTARRLRPALPVAARKPAASGASRLNTHADAWIATDTRRLADASGESWEQVTRFAFGPPISPARAARKAGIDATLPRLLQACRAPQGRWTLVEGAGGFYSPLGSDDSLNADLAAALKLPVLLVVANRLGCINHTLLTIDAILTHGLKLAGVILNNTLPDASVDAETAGELSALLPDGTPFFALPHRAPPHSLPEWGAWLLDNGILPKPSMP